MKDAKAAGIGRERMKYEDIGRERIEWRGRQREG
jgi:hypothetical protein